MVVTGTGKVRCVWHFYSTATDDTDDPGYWMEEIPVKEWAIRVIKEQPFY